MEVVARGISAARDGEGRSLLAVLGEHVVGEARGVGAVVPGSQGELDDMLAEEKVKWKQKSLLAVVGEHEARGVVAVVPGSQWEVDNKMEEEVQGWRMDMLKMREMFGEHEARAVVAVVPGSQGELDDMLEEEKVKWKQESLLAVVGEQEARGVVAVVPGSQWEVDDKMEEEVQRWRMDMLEMREMMREMFSNQLPVPHERRHFLLFLLPKSTFMTQLMKNKKRGVD